MPITRREFAASLSAPLVFDNSALPPDFIRRHDESVDQLLRRQITTPNHPWQGSILDDDGLCAGGTAAGIADSLIAAYVCPQSRHHAAPEIAARFRLAAACLQRSQHSDGTIDLPTTNFNSPPDLAFTIHNASAAAAIARQYSHPELFQSLEPFLRRAAEALIVGGIHTPNHRWVVCEALAELNELMPDPRLPNRAAQWLAEGIDLDSDGQFFERSTSVYNAVSCKALLVAGLKFNKPQLLDAVRRNLDSMLYLLHPGGEVVTEISSRQDQFTRAGMERYWFPLRFLALRDSNGHYATLTQSLEDRAAGLSFYLRYPELNQPLPALRPIPDDYSKPFPASQIVRTRRGPLSATLALAPRARFFHIRNGDCVIESVRLASAFFGRGQFKPAKAESIPGGYRLTQQIERGYNQPLSTPKPLTVDELGVLSGQRAHTQLQHLHYEVLVREKPQGFELEINATGTPGVPVTLELAVREGTRLEGVVEKKPDQFLLREGHATLSSGAAKLRVGPGLGDHSYVQVRGAEPKLPGPAIYLCGFTPFRHTFSITAV